MFKCNKLQKEKSIEDYNEKNLASDKKVSNCSLQLILLVYNADCL